MGFRKIKLNISAMVDIYIFPAASQQIINVQHFVSPGYGNKIKESLLFFSLGYMNIDIYIYICKDIYIYIRYIENTYVLKE